MPRYPETVQTQPEPPAGAEPPPPDVNTSAESDGPPGWVVVGLLLLIFGLLTFMWYRERQGRLGWQKKAIELSETLTLMQQSGPMMQQMAAQAAQRHGQGVRRDDLPTRTVNVDGQSRTAILVSASAGRRMGFLPGDWVIVAGAPQSPPTTAPAPATAPATRQGP